jgi:hypothetical protein
MEGEGEREHLGGAVGPEAVVGATPHLEGAPAVAVLGERQHHDVDLGGQHERRGQPRRRGAQVRLDDPALRGGAPAPRPSIRCPAHVHRVCGDGGGDGGDDNGGGGGDEGRDARRARARQWINTAVDHGRTR